MTAQSPHTPFRHSSQLCRDLDTASLSSSSPCLPGQPSILLADKAKLTAFLHNEFWAKDLEDVATKLWILTTTSSGNVQPLHRQKVLGREIVVTEDPRLHLLWVNDRIFVKPLPLYLLSHTFWSTHMLSSHSVTDGRSRQVREAAMGFLRTYRHLIRHESDLIIAQHSDLRLVSPTLSWMQVSTLLADLETLVDADVSPRYHFGEIRLSRLNFYAPLLFRRFYYDYTPIQYGQYYTHLFGPALLLFAVITTILNAMQVSIAASDGLRQHPIHALHIFYWFGVVSLVAAAAIGIGFALLWLGMVGDEWIFAYKNRPKSRHPLTH